MMCSSVRQDASTLSWEEDLDSTLSNYEIMAILCEVTDEEKMRAAPVMLSGDGLIYNSSHGQQCNTYEDAKGAIKEWYDTADKRSRILIKCQSLHFTKELTISPNNSQVEVFRSFVAEKISLQK